MRVWYRLPNITFWEVSGKNEGIYNDTALAIYTSIKNKDVFGEMVDWFRRIDVTPMNVKWQFEHDVLAEEVKCAVSWELDDEVATMFRLRFS